jgi:hypothetical protein
MRPLEPKGIELIRTPVRAANANAVAERWIGIARSKCVDRMLILRALTWQHSTAALPPP